MLFIFRVDIGTMINLEMNLALETVAHLQTAIASYCNIPVDKQVLLISGGESLESNERVCKYTAGSSDSNPIFLFSVSTLEGSLPPVLSDTFQERDLQPEVESSLSLPDTHNSVSVRTNLAQEYVKMSREQVRCCEREIHDQHLQHQGWAAALANLEDSVLAIEKRNAAFIEAYNIYLEKREHYRQVIETFDDDIHILNKIPVLPALMDDLDSGNETSSRMDVRKNGSYLGRSDNSMSLLDWINQAGNSSLEQVADSCYRSLEQMDAAFLESKKSQIFSCIEGANNQQMKEIGGLGDRLSGLEQLLLDANKKVAEQKDLAAAFLQNQARASGLKDTSILPDLCASHKQQLLVMMRNHQHIVSIRKRCVKAKSELSHNVYTRLKWVMYIQRQMAEQGQQLVLYYEELKRLSRRLEVLEQLHLAPSMYVATVVEIVRRRSFSEQYLRKTSIFASNFSSVYNDEVKVRQAFQEKINKHFLATMFKGMGDVPPPFATKGPDTFDEKLPALSLSDLETLRSQLPELAESLSVPDTKTLSNLLTRSFTQNLTQDEDNAMQNLQNMTNKISINGNGLGSVSMMNRMCFDPVNRKKKDRLEALALSRERELGSETDSDEENISKGKTKLSRKMTRSLPSRGETRLTPVKNSLDQDQSRDTVSSSSVDPSSSCVNTNSSNAPSSDGSLLKQTWPSQTQMDEKAREIEKLNLLLGSAGEEREKVESRIATILGVSGQGLTNLRSELNLIRTQVEEERKDLLTLLSDMSIKLILNLRELETLQGSESELKIERKRREEVEQDLQAVSDKLETEVHKLEDCNNEINIYRHQLQELSSSFDNLQVEMKEEKVQSEKVLKETEEKYSKMILELKTEQEEKMRELKQKLELEHELEFDNLKQQLETGELTKLADAEEQLRKLKAKVKESDQLSADLQTKVQLMDITNDERIKEEKEKIVQILEAGFSERQRLAIAELEASLKASHQAELQEIQASNTEEMCARLEELRQKMIDSSQTNLQRVLERKEKDWQAALKQRELELEEQFAEERRQFTLAKQKEMDDVSERIRKKSKMDLDSLRSRFKIMQTTATLDRSPSVSESDLSFEELCAAKHLLPVRRPRCYSTGESFKSPRPESTETDGKLEEKYILERGAWEREKEKLVQQVEFMLTQQKENELRFKEEKEELLRNIEVVRKTEKTRGSAEKQVIFNEALKKTVEEKDRVISELEAQLNQISGRGQSNSADLESQLAQVSRKNAQLESELRDANQKLANSMLCSIAVETDESLKQLQEENRQLRDQLTRSMTSLINTGKVSVLSAERGEIVLVVWSEVYSNYSIYHEGSILHFLHTESVESLGLSLERGVPRKIQITAEVVEKEYCQARKPENRFRVPQGTKFYRVKCKPIEKDEIIKST